MKVVTRLADRPFDAADELARFLSSLEGEGGIVSFVGVARPARHDGSAVTGLWLDHHPRLTARSVEEIGAGAVARFGISRIGIVHRIGRVEAGEPIVFVAAAAAHRRAAFEAADHAMDRLKTDAVFWKREDGVGGSRWIEPSQQDRDDRARWSAPCRE